MRIQKVKEVEMLPGVKIGGNQPFFLIAGPCVIENLEELRKAAKCLEAVQKNTPLPIVFKSSFDKANRSSHDSYRGPGISEGLSMLKAIKEEFGFPLITDVHTTKEAEVAAETVDILQIPAFLSRQTDLLVAAARTGKWVNVKKGQFMAPLDALKIAEKFDKSGSNKLLICERGYTFGYNNLVVDMRSIEIMRSYGLPVVIDITHSTQLPGGGVQSGGQREMAYPIGRAAVAVGVDGVFMEIHSNPEKAMSDSTTQLPLDAAADIVDDLYKIDRLVKS